MTTHDVWFKWKQEQDAKNNAIRTVQSWRQEVEAKRNKITNVYTTFDQLFRKEG